jgi:hypothetical protein
MYLNYGMSTGTPNGIIVPACRANPMRVELEVIKAHDAIEIRNKDGLKTETRFLANSKKWSKVKSQATLKGSCDF